MEIVGVAAPDVAGDAALLELTAAGVGHASVIRSFAEGLDAADIDLALHYLPDIRAIVLVEPVASIVAPAAAAATWSDAGLIVVGPLGPATARAIDAEGGPAIVLEAPPADPDGTFSGFVATLASELESGRPASEAWRQTVSTLAADRIG